MLIKMLVISCTGQKSDSSDINQIKNSYGICKKPSKSVTTTIQLVLEIQVKKKSTEFSKYIWKLKSNSINHDLQWSVAFNVHSYTGGTRKCDLCLTEKVAIMKVDPVSLLINTIY